MTAVHEVVGALLRTQVLRVHYLTGDPDRFYTVRAPCLLAQLAEAVGVGSERLGATRAAGARLLVSADALDLWVAVVTSVHAWAEQLGVDRRPYLPMTPLVRRRVEREPAWVGVTPAFSPVLRCERSDLSVDTCAHCRGASQQLPVVQPPARGVERMQKWMDTVPVDEVPAFTTREIPPVGLLLRAVAAAAVAQRQDQVAETIAHRAQQWAGRITALLGLAGEDNPARPLYGAACPLCEATMVWDEQAEQGRVQVPAIAVQVATLSAGEWVYWLCRACGEAGWLRGPGTSMVA